MITFDPEALRGRLAGLEAAMAEPGFWDDQQRAARISTEHARLSRRLERYERLTPLGRMATEDDLTGALGWLVSDASAYVTGQTIAVDGGWTAW